MDPVTIDWSTADVHDGELTVPLKGERPKGWKEHFKTTARLLGEPPCGELSLKKNHLLVIDVRAGHEDELRHHLEAIVTQANAATAADHDREEREEGPAAINDEDERMTEQFRSFAAADDGER